MKTIQQRFQDVKSEWFNSCTMLIVEEFFKKLATHYSPLCK
jgi:hypothetical protein